MSEPQSKYDLNWREARLAGYDSSLANLDKLIGLASSDSIARIRASLQARRDELAAEIAAMKDEQNGKTDK